MKFNVIVEEDSITPYLDNINTRLHASRKEIAYEIGRFFEETASANAPEWHGNLSQSADNPDAWQYIDEGEFVRLDIVFTGLADDVDEWWWEFENPWLPKGGRDYAYFQETGGDRTASSKYARSKWYVRKSAEPTMDFGYNYLKKEIKRIMNAHE